MLNMLNFPILCDLLPFSMFYCANEGKMLKNLIIAAAASEPEANERGSSVISRRLLYRACNHFFLLNARNCGYAQVEDLGCAVVCREELWLCANVKI